MPYLKTENLFLKSFSESFFLSLFLKVFFKNFIDKTLIFFAKFTRRVDCTEIFIHDVRAKMN